MVSIFCHPYTLLNMSPNRTLMHRLWLLVAGNLRHLVVEACIARNILDTSAYFWPGYVKGRCNQIPCGIGQIPGWSSLMKGSPITPTMISVMVSTPASRYDNSYKL